MSSHISGRDRARPSRYAIWLHRFVRAIVMTATVALAEDVVPRDKDYDYDPPVPGSYTLPVVKDAADGAIVDSSGKTMRLHDVIRGRITVLSFIYTRCAAPKACPYAVGVLNQIYQFSATDPVLAKNLRLVSMSFDPEFDTPQRLATYAENFLDEKSGCEWRFATTKSRGDLESILTGYGQAVDKREDPRDPQGPLYHVLRLFLIDRAGRIRNIYSSGTLDLRLIVADVKTLTMENDAKPVTAR